MTCPQLNMTTFFYYNLLLILNFHALRDWIQRAHGIFIIWQDRKSEPSDKFLLNQDLPYGPFSWKHHKPCIFFFFFLHKAANSN